MASNMITNRTRADVNAINVDSSIPSKGAYNYTDLNRVEQKVKELNNLLVQENYMTALTTKMNWEYTDKFSQADATRYLNNIKALRNALAVKSTTPKVPSTMNKMTYTTANNIEKILVDIEDIVNGLRDWYVRSGVASCGQNRLWQHRFRDYRSEYTLLTYIESQGGCIIDTGIYLDENTRLEHTLACQGVDCLNNNDNPNTTSNFRCKWGSNGNGNGEVYYGWGGSNVTSGTTATLSDIYTFNLQNGNQQILNASTSAVISASTATSLTKYPTYGIKINSNISGTTMRTYRFKAYRNSELIKDFIPVLDRSGEPCLFEQVDGLFYYNYGTNSLTYS